MTYRELQKKYMLKEITEDEYKRELDKIFIKLFDLYAEGMIDEDILKNKIDLLKNKKEKPLSY